MPKNLIYQYNLVLERKRPIRDNEWDHDSFRLINKILLDRHFYLCDCWTAFPLIDKKEGKPYIGTPMSIPLSYIKKYFRNTNRIGI